MGLPSFGEWMLSEAKKWEKCPYPRNKEFCQEYKRFLRGEISVAPNIEDFGQKTRIFGHKQGRRAGPEPTRGEVMKRKSELGKGRYKWRPD